MTCENEGEMTTASRRRRSSAAGPLEDDDLLSEILLRLPPQPSSLPRASAVCKLWHSLVSDARFLRRFRIRHSRSPPPLLGCFSGGTGLSFIPALDAPNRVPPERFSLQIDDGDRLYPRGCRHGLVLIFDLKQNQFLVWDPITGDRHRVAVPPGFEGQGISNPIHGAVRRARVAVPPCCCSPDFHFQLVLVMADIDEIHHRQVVARVYSSQTGLWGKLISRPLPPEANQGWYPTRVCQQPAVLVGDSLYWMLAGIFGGILEFDFDRQSLAVIQVPVNMFEADCCFTVMRAEGGGMGFLFVSNFTAQAQLWKRKTASGGVVSWGLERTIELDKLLSLNSKKKYIRILGYAEDNNLVFMCTPIGFLMVQLQSWQVTRLSETNLYCPHHPFESVYTTGNSMPLHSRHNKIK
uniref:Uncharacterized protein n=1 Tax=Avena sativa TaxID=4498 RepID=A0ACD5VA25_AVESA